MGKLRPLSARQVGRILESQGFRAVRQKGSHIAYQQSQNNITLTAIVPNHEEIRLGTLSSIIRQSRLPRELFEKTD